MFVHFNGNIVNSKIINSINCEDYVESGVVYVYFDGQPFEAVKGAEATNLIMALCPSVLEGEEAKYARHAWAVHNLIGHPLMQIFSWLHLTSLGIKIHDATVPKPMPIE